MTNHIDIYIAKLDEINEGERKATLNKIARHLRRRFGLQGTQLLLCLQEINVAKCNSPLTDEVINVVAVKTDNSNVTLGSSCSVDVYLEKRISLFSSLTNSEPKGTGRIKEFIIVCKFGKFREQVEKIRAESDKSRRDDLKRNGLLCVTIQSEECETRKKEFCKNNAVLCIDFDSIDGNMEEAKQLIAAVPYVFCVCVSTSGRGIFALAALAEPTEDLKPVLVAMQEDFELPIDMSGSDVSRARLVSFDPDLILKDTVIPFIPCDDSELSQDTADSTDELSSVWGGAPQPGKNELVVVNNLPPATEAIIEHCRHEVARRKPAIEGQGGDKQTFAVSCLIFYHWGLSVSEGRPIFDEYNARCLPPWDEKQLQSKIDCAITASSEQPRGWKRWENPIEGDYCPMFGAFLLNPKRTSPSAYAFRRAKYSHEEGFLLRYYGGDFYRWTGNYYEQVHKDVIKREVLDWLTKAVTLNTGYFKQHGVGALTCGS